MFQLKPPQFSAMFNVSIHKNIWMLHSVLKYQFVQNLYRKTLQSYFTSEFLIAFNFEIVGTYFQLLYQKLNEYSLIAMYFAN